MSAPVTERPVKVRWWPSHTPLGQECSECTTGGRKGYCARGRCLCGHPTCWAFESYAPVPPPGPPVGKCPNGARYAADGGCCGEVHP